MSQKTLEQYKKAYHSVAKEDRARGFYMHLAIYLFINTISAILNYFLTPDFLWVIFPVFFWGIGITWNYVSAFILVDKKLEKLDLEAEKRAKNNSN